MLKDKSMIGRALRRGFRFRMTNKWKNLSRFWSPRERRLQKRLDQFHRDFGKLLVQPADFKPLGDEEDHTDIREVPKMFPDQENGYLG